jgi:hypothetical protein
MWNVAHIFRHTTTTLFFPHDILAAPPGAVDSQMLPHLQRTSSTSEINKCEAPGPQICILARALDLTVDWCWPNLANTWISRVFDWSNA